MRTNHSYFVCMVETGCGLEAVVDPEVTRREVVRRIEALEWEPDDILFIHHIDGKNVEDVTESIFKECNLTWAQMWPSDRLAALHDHNRKLRDESF